jgi:hypothetical protein
MKAQQFGTAVLLLSVAAIAGAVLLQHRPVQAMAASGKVQIGGRVVDQDGAGIPGVTVTVWLSGVGAQDTVMTDANGNYHFEIPAGGVIDVSYYHSARGSSSVKQLSGLADQQIGPVLLGEPSKMSALAAQAELLSLKRLTFLAMVNSEKAPPALLDFLRGNDVVQRAEALGKGSGDWSPTERTVVGQESRAAIDLVRYSTKR